MSKDFKITLVLILLIGGLIMFKLIVLGPENGKKFEIPDGPAPKHPRPVAAAPQVPAPASAPDSATSAAPAEAATNP